MMRFADLSEQEILALAIASEEEDSKIYRSFAEGLREQYPASAKIFDEMADEEVRHRTMLFDLYRSKFGEYLPLIRRQDVKGFVKHRPLWLNRPLGLDEVRKYAETMELEWAKYYHKAAQSAHDSSIRELLDKLADAEDEHETLAHKLGETVLTKTARAREDETSRRLFVLQYVQPGLAGLMDGSVSTLAPLFAAASPHIIRGRPSSSELLLQLVPASPWHLPRRCLTTARSRGGARRCFVARFVGR
jgi:erythrin-vacuolar iron transport family protein